MEFEKKIGIYYLVVGNLANSCFDVDDMENVQIHNT